MDINFIETYVPAIEELDRQTVLATRDSLQQFVNLSFPDLATQPGTVIGDLLVTPQSYILSSFQVGAERILSDLCLENVAEGNVYNCDFVIHYIKNLGVPANMNYPSTGVVRITFSEDKDYLLDRSTQFKIGDNIYKIYLPNPRQFICFKTDSVIDRPGINGSRLKALDDGTWYCDVPVIGNNGEVNITASEDVEISQYIPQITAITTLTPFSNGSVNRTVEQLAKDTQHTIYSASLNTRNGAVQYVTSVCPFVESVYALKNDDREVLRAYNQSPGYGIAMGCMDVYARSNAYEFTEQQVVKLVKNNTHDWFEGEWHYTGQPYHVESITNSNVDLEQLEYDILSYNDEKLGAMVTYSSKEKLYLRVKDIVENNQSLFNTFKENGQTFAYFTITYQTDPLLPYIAQTIENPEHQPINASVYVRGFIPVIIEQFKVVYVKKRGVVPDLEKAKDDIKVYLASVGAPNGYTDAEISRIMGEAGVQYMKRVDVQARVQWSVANYIIELGKEAADDKWASPDIVPVIEYPFIRDSDGLRVTYPNKGVDIQPGQMYSCSPKNIKYFVLENAITFKEVIDV